MRPPRIVVYGAGLVGAYLGGRMHRHARVRLVARPHVAAVLAEHGLTVSDLNGHLEPINATALDVQTTADSASDADLVLVTVKSAATAAVARELSQVLKPNAVVISFQNGLSNAARLREDLRTQTVLSGMVPFNVAQLKPGHFHQGSAGALMVQASPALAPFIDTFARSCLPLEQRSDMDAVLWAKLLFNLNNPLNALSGLPLREELSQRDWRRCLALLQHEALSALDRAGIQPARMSPLPPHWIPRLLRLPDAWFSRIAARMLAIDPLARSSMWDDLQAGRRTEVDYINGEVVALASSVGRNAPANARLIALIREAEQKPVQWDGAALWRELKQA